MTEENIKISAAANSAQPVSVSNGEIIIAQDVPTTICYQEILQNGEMSPVRQITFSITEDIPYIAAETVPNYTAPSVQVKINELYSLNGDIHSVYMFRNGRQVKSV